VFDLLLSSGQPQSFLEWTCANFEQSLAEYHTILLEEHLQVALEMLEVGNKALKMNIQFCCPVTCAAKVL
jgi:hypothetical protein